MKRVCNSFNERFMPEQPVSYIIFIVIPFSFTGITFTAPILLGNAVLDELASVEVDNVEKTINFYKK